MPAPPSLATAWSLACRVMMLTSLAFDSPNNLTVEFVTSSTVKPDGVAMCLPVAASSLSVSLSSLVEGGSQFETSATQLVSDPANLMSDSFFAPSRTWSRQPLHYVNMSDLVQASGSDAPWLGPWSPAMALGQMWKGVFAVNGEKLQQQAVLGWSQGCFVVTGAWQSHTKYTMSFTITNPPKSYSTAAKPLLWMAPLTYKRKQQGKKGNSTLVYAVRGRKLGNACTYRPGLLHSTVKYYDACGEAAQAGAVAADLASIQSCIRFLQKTAAAGGGALHSTFPFDQVPFTMPSNTSSTPCAAGSLPSVSTPGECIRCSGGAIQAGACKCDQNMVTQPVGLDACGPVTSPSGKAVAAADIGRELCDNAHQVYQGIQQGKLSDRVAAKQLLRAVAEQAGHLIDWEGIMEANVTFWQMQKADPRAAGAASRGQGVAPNCDQCTDGKFVDVFTGKLVPVYDDRFQAVQALRLVGYILTHHTGYECKSLYSSSHLKLRDLYETKPYDSTICKPLPA